MTGIQALERKSVDKLMKPGQLVKREFEYIRHGTQSLIASFDLSSGKIVHESISQTRTELDFVSHLQRMIEANQRVKKWHLVMDCLNIHVSESLVRTDCTHRKYSCRHIRQKRSVWLSPVNEN